MHRALARLHLTVVACAIAVVACSDVKSRTDVVDSARQTVANVQARVVPSSVWASGDSLKLVGPDSAFRVHFTTAAKPEVARYARFLAAGVAANETFFKSRYPKSFDVYVYDHRSALDSGLRSVFKDTAYASPCWLAAIGEAEGVYMLAPVRWESETCEGRYTTYSDTTKTGRLFTHELTHVLNAQILSAQGRRYGTDDIAWFREGVAMLVAGQLGAPEQRAVRAALKAGSVPTSLNAIANLADVGLRYNLMGSLAQHIDRTFGRTTLKALMSLDTQAAILSTLGVSEKDFLAAWRQSS